MEEHHIRFWSTVELLLATKVPVYVKNTLQLVYQSISQKLKTTNSIHLIFFSLCGFCDALSIKNINKEIIDQIEEYIRKDLVSIIQKLENSESHTVVNHSDFFGNTQLIEPSSFKFLIGERIQMEEIALFLKSIVAGDNLKYGIEVFTDEKQHKKVNYMGTVVYPHFGRFFTSSNKLINSVTELAVKALPAPSDFQSLLYDNIFNLLVSMNVEKKMLELFHNDMVSVKIDEENNPIGCVKCVFCISDNVKRKQIEFSIRAKSEGGKHYWINSNFKKHLTIMHKVISNKPAESDAEINLEKRKEKVHTTEEISKSKLEDGEQSEHNPENEDLKTAVYVNTNQDTDYHSNFENHHVQANYIDSTASLLFKSPKNSYDVLLSMIYKQVCAQLVQIFQLAHQNDEPQAKMIFICENTKRSSKIVPIARDGNCLFSAIIHQLFQTNLKKETHKIMTDELRSTVATYIDKNFSSFKNELQGRVYDNFSNKPIEDMDTECRKIVSNLSGKGYFGGIETLKAVTLIYEVNILVISEEGECYFATAFEPKFGKTLILAYKLDRNESTNVNRNHYDSIVHVDAQDVFAITRLLTHKTCTVMTEPEEIITIDESYLDESSQTVFDDNDNDDNLFNSSIFFT